MDVFVARQPIFDREHKVVAYELLYRRGEHNYFDGSVSSNVATSILLMNTYYSFGINNLTDNCTAYINFSKALIENDIPLLLDEKQVVIELLEEIKADFFFTNKVKYLKEKGYTIALDDFVASDLNSELLELADIIKVDFLLNTKEETRRIAQHCKNLGKILVAEKIETEEMYEFAKKIGYDLFQGYFFCRPSVMKSKTISDSVYQYTRLMEKLSEPEPDYGEISSIIEVDVTLTYKLLKLVNSRFSLVSNVKSVRHALSILGIYAFTKWLSLAIIQNNVTHKNSELIKISMIRAHFMELITAESVLKDYASEVTLIGILSAIDVLLETPMHVVVKSLPLSEEIKETLMGQPTVFSPIFKIVMDYEQGLFESINELCETIRFDSNLLPDMYVEAVKWAEDLYDYMQ